MRPQRNEWRFVLEFLRDTDPVLLQRISRKLVNHLSWNGFGDAKELLQRAGIGPIAGQAVSGKRTVPCAASACAHTADLTTEAFRLASEHLSENEILACVTTWIKEEKSSFLVRALEQLDTPLGEIIEAIERYRHTDIDESELSLSTQKGLRVSLIRRFFSESLDFINVAKNAITVKDFYDLLGQIIFPPRCHGKLGGKSAGLVPRQEDHRQACAGRQRAAAGEGSQDLVHHLRLDSSLRSPQRTGRRSQLEVHGDRPGAAGISRTWWRCSRARRFRRNWRRDCRWRWTILGDRPIIVRSSSLLEDRAGSAFSGKYKSLFLGNQGTKEERLAALMDAIAEVYASIFGPDPTEYRAERGLLDVHEEMGILIQEVVGQAIGKYFFPACSGVAFSNNEFRWSARISRSDGLIRLVPGLGTRAVDRVADDYPC